MKRRKEGKRWRKEYGRIKKEEEEKGRNRVGKRKKSGRNKMYER